VDIALNSYQDALEYLYARTTGAFKFGLERTIALLRELGDPHMSFPSLHIAGTNGKGSSVATADALLRGRGLRVAKYTSPHLVDFRERIVVDGAPIPEADVLEFVSRYTPVVERLGASFFEATTVMAFEHFARANVDVAIIETGLGGRLDSTNVITPVAAGVTSIGLDHTEYLGPTLVDIAVEKAGIFKRGRAAVVGEIDAHIREVLGSEARRHGASSVRYVAEECAVSDVIVQEGGGGGGTSFTLRAFGDERRLRSPLAGRHQAMNTAFTLLLLASAGNPYATSLREAERLLTNVRVPGRFQRVGSFIFDVAHNAEGTAVLAQTLTSVAPPRPIITVLSVLRDKDWRRMMQTLEPVVDRFVLTVAPTAPSNRAWDLSEVEQFAREEGIVAETERDFASALESARVHGGTTLVTGSFHTVGDAMLRLQVSPFTG
jgi:dihydrofolate synthase / folylpolyglutamate synthase